MFVWAVAALPLAAEEPGPAPRVVSLVRAAGPYEEPAQAISKRLAAASIDGETIVLPGENDAQTPVYRQLSQSPPAVIVAGGALATATALEAVPGIAVAFFMVPNAPDAPRAGSTASSPATFLFSSMGSPGRAGQSF